MPEEFGELTAFAAGLLQRYGAPASLALLYIEESGVPLPIPGDTYVVYLGHAASGAPPRLVAAWLAVTAVVLAGASNLYLATRLWGGRYLEGRLAALLRLDPSALAAAESRFRRWGPAAIIFGRHVPGFRIPITVVAATSRVPYRVFAPSVAVSTAIWAGIWIWLGATFGDSALHFLSQHRWTYLIFVAVVLIAAGLVFREVLRARRD